MSRIRVTGLTRTFPGRPPVDALRGVDLEVEAGQIVAVLGPSGCGKTTLLRVLAGLERPDGGTIELGGDIIDGPGTHRPPDKRRVGLVPQEGALFPHLNVAANLAFGLRGRPRAARSSRGRELLELIGLHGMGDRKPHELSGGQQQRVALARALAPQPEVVLLDEPFSALDAGLRVTLRDEVAATLRATGTTAVLVTHDQTEALSMADTVAVMRDGAILQLGSPTEVYQRPVDLWSARFLGEVVELPDGGVCRPEQLMRVGPDAPGALVATVRSTRFQGPDALVHLTIDGIETTARWPSVDLPADGSVVGVAVAGPVLDVR